MARRIRPFFALSAVLVLAAACSRETKIDSGKTETLIQDQVTPRPKAVTCPGDVSAERGKSFECGIEMQNGQRGTITVHMTDDKGRIRIGPGDLHLQR